MLTTKTYNLTLTLQKATEGFTAIADQPTDIDIIDTCQLLLPILMQTKYSELKLTHNLSGVILPTGMYKHIYGKTSVFNSVHSCLIQKLDLTSMQRLQKYIRQRGNTRPSGTTAPSMTRPTWSAKNSSWKSLTGCGKRISRTRTRSIWTSRT